MSLFNLITALTQKTIGGALIPWVYSIVILLVHIPVVIIRVVRWQTVKTWCLAATFSTITITAQAYVSTEFQAEKILTWTPVLLVIDAGSMSQVLFLIIEDFNLLSRLRHSIVPRNDRLVGENLLGGRRAEKIGKCEGCEEGQITTRSIDEVTSTTGSGVEQRHPALFTSKPLYIAVTALILLLSVFILQILGLSHAHNATKSTTPAVSWCSPIFQPFGIAVLDGNCNIWPIQQTFSKGVGCILIPGIQQMAWLKATVAGTGLAIAFELIDICILATVHSGTRWRGVKMRRPWFTMFSGVAVLGLMLVFGVVYSNVLPPGISEKVWVVTDAGTVTVYEGELGTAGLRGAMIGWNDGVFQAWGMTYFGSWAR
ncbi:hypothetical protein MMC28_009556 [Mycoblastus sanguinarius]|nr:hypothetical protein [Mycoblastus sanguinarius]